jgi:hypothetical protein
MPFGGEWARATNKPMSEPESALASDCSQKEVGTRLQANSYNFLRLEREIRSPIS